MKKLLFTFGVIAVLLLVLFPFARNAEPSSSLYSFKRLQENLILASKTNPEGKAEYHSELLNIRLKELIRIVEGKQNSLVLSASLRYSVTAGKYTEVIKQNNLTHETTNVKKQFNNHKNTLMSLETKYQRYTETDDTAKFIRDAINYLDLYAKDLP